MSAGRDASVDSFSQLPFARRHMPAPRPAAGVNSIRLFGFDVPPEAAVGVAEEDGKGGTAGATAQEGGGSGIRKFECHYCCRKFPTSQALGGHQNAHKRERQHAKRAQFQTAMAMHHYTLSDPAHVYSAYPHHHHRYSSVLPPPPHYPTWAGARYYCGPGSISQPITGCPVAPGLWHVPGAAAAVGEYRHEPTAHPVSFSPSTSSSSSSSASPHERRRGPPEQKENVSLDLSL